MQQIKQYLTHKRGQYGKQPRLKAISFKFSVPFLRALKRYTHEERQRTGDSGVNQTVVLETYALRSDRLRELYNEELALEAGHSSKSSPDHQESSE